eukprot:IDg19384t1
MNSSGSPLTACGSFADRVCRGGEADLSQCLWDFGAALNAGEVGPTGL